MTLRKTKTLQRWAFVPVVLVVIGMLFSMRFVAWWAWPGPRSGQITLRVGDGRLSIQRMPGRQFYPAEFRIEPNSGWYSPSRLWFRKAEASFFHLDVPLWVLLLIAALPPAVLTWRIRKELMQCRCAACGYDLRGSTASTKCPECGVELIE